jgi:hypothetical protein
LRLTRLLVGLLVLLLLLLALDLLALLALAILLLGRILLVGVVHGFVSMFAAATGMAPLPIKRPAAQRSCSQSRSFRTSISRRFHMKIELALLAAAFAVVPSIAFAANDADCTAEWAQADANKDGVLHGPEADRYLAYIRIRSQTSPQDGKIAQEAFMSACKADTFKAKAPEPGAPLKGANSFTETQAKDRAVAAGVSNVSTMQKDPDGIWRGKGKKAGSDVEIAVDFKGNVVTQ